MNKHLKGLTLGPKLLPLQLRWFKSTPCPSSLITMVNLSRARVSPGGTYWVIMDFSVFSELGLEAGDRV